MVSIVVEVVLLVDEVLVGGVLVVDEVVVDEVVVVVVGGGVQPLTQKTLCLVSAPCDPSALTVSLT